MSQNRVDDTSFADRQSHRQLRELIGMRTLSAAGLRSDRERAGEHKSVPDPGIYGATGDQPVIRYAVSDFP